MSLEKHRYAAMDIHAFRVSGRCACGVTMPRRFRVRKALDDLNLHIRVSRAFDRTIGRLLPPAT